MSFQRTVKLFTIGAAVLGMAGCSTGSTTASSAESSVKEESSAVTSTVSSETAVNVNPLKVLCPQGAPALATLGLEKDDASVEYVEGQDLLVSELSKKDGEYDMIVAPVNVGIKTWKEAEAYEMYGVLTWGNLYVVSKDAEWNEPGKTIALFGEGAVPGLVFNTLYPDLQATAEYYPSVAEASAAIIAGKADAALLAQPAAAGAINKAAQNDLALETVADLQSEWQEKEGTEKKGYPQAALFVKKGKADDYSAAIEKMAKFIDEADTARIEEAVDLMTPETLGVPSAKLAAATWKEQNIHLEKAADVKDDLQKFLDVFGLAIPEGLIAE
ncbi:hypothetical protein [Allobaculum mucilyticum]|uniref:hypothetical protein n=1 Tax=Allobaculum mucilyticum TaxID=2834459 RepID=UPI001E64517F|nr:hypothetical protein [Allobaculum mucilyticum]UNT95628.1 hypothetical protein KWG62_09960 [Allobaculum mucilyticum]